MGGALGTGKLMAALAIVIGIGATTIVLLSRGDDAEPRPPTVAPAEMPATPVDVAPAASPPKVEHLSTAPVPEPPPPPTITRPKTSTPAPSEASLLLQAWSAISSGDPRRALELAHRDARLYPAGIMREERTAIEVVALAKLGRTTDAHVAAKQFLVRYPTSLHRALVEQSISMGSP